MSEIRYFIFDTGVTLKNPDYTKHDKEFTQYFWSLGRYNKVREGDKFIDLNRKNKTMKIIIINIVEVTSSIKLNFDLNIHKQFDFNLLIY